MLFIFFYFYSEIKPHNTSLRYTLKIVHETFITEH